MDGLTEVVSGSRAEFRRSIADDSDADHTGAAPRPVVPNAAPRADAEKRNGTTQF